MSGKQPRLVIGISGASGAIYAKRLLESLARLESHQIIVLISAAGRRVVHDELGVRIKQEDAAFCDWLDVTESQAQRLRWAPISDIGGGPASGNYPIESMAIVPCSMRTLAAIACGLADNLMTRAADVCLKEARRLVLSPRECPLNAIHLENMLKLSRLGVRIVPPMPGFYHGPERIDDLVQYVVQKIVEQMGLEPADPIRWGES